MDLCFIIPKWRTDGFLMNVLFFGKILQMSAEICKMSSTFPNKSLQNSINLFNPRISVNKFHSISFEYTEFCESKRKYATSSANCLRLYFLNLLVILKIFIGQNKSVNYHTLIRSPQKRRETIANLLKYHWNNCVELETC